MLSAPLHYRSRCPENFEEGNLLAERVAEGQRTSPAVSIYSSVKKDNENLLHYASAFPDELSEALVMIAALARRSALSQLIEHIVAELRYHLLGYRLLDPAL